MLKNWQAKEEDVDATAAARQEDPFAVLGPHLTAEGWTIPEVALPDGAAL
jgi:hypothetical protein